MATHHLTRSSHQRQGHQRQLKTWGARLPQVLLQTVQQRQPLALSCSHKTTVRVCRHQAPVSPGSPPRQQQLLLLPQRPALHLWSLACGFSNSSSSRGQQALQQVALAEAAAAAGIQGQTLLSPATARCLILVPPGTPAAATRLAGGQRSGGRAARMQARQGTCQRTPQLHQQQWV